MPDPADSPTIAYLTSAYARAADTFIRGEVDQLRRRGFNVHTFSIRRAADEEVSDDVRAEQRHTHYILEQGKLALMSGFVREAVTRPARMLRAAALAWRTRAAGLGATLRQAVYLIEAADLARQLRDRGVEHLHNHIPENSASVAMLASELIGIPWSMTVHGPTTFYEPARWALDEKVARASFTACITHFCRSQMMLFTRPEHWDKLKLVRVGLDAAFLERTPRPIPTTPRLLFVGRLCGDKGPLLLIDAVARLRREGVAVELAMVGDGPMRSEIEAMIERHGLGDHVTLLGWRSSDAVRTEIERSRALVLPSFAEGLPVVIMEAMALGRPVVTTYIAGIPELVEPGVETGHGWLVPAGSVEPLVDAMREAVTSEVDVLEAMGRRGAAAVRARHDAAAEAANLDALIRQSIREAHVSPEPQRRDEATVSREPSVAKGGG